MQLLACQGRILKCFATSLRERQAVCNLSACRRLQPAPAGSRPWKRQLNAAVMFPAGSAGVKVWLQQKWAAARSQLKAPSVALDSVCITQGHLRAHITGEPVPRHFEQVHMSLRLGRDYKSLAIDLQGTAFPDNVLPLVAGLSCHEAAVCLLLLQARQCHGKVLTPPVRQTLLCRAGFGQATRCDAAILPARSCGA